MNLIKINTRNQHGIKDSCNMYRKVNGIEFQQWFSEGSVDENDEVRTIEAYRKKHPEYKFIKRGDEIFRSVNPITGN